MGRKDDRKRHRNRRGGALGRFLFKVALLFAILATAVSGVFLYLRTRSVPYRVARLQEEAALHLRLGSPRRRSTRSRRRLDSCRRSPG